MYKLSDSSVKTYKFPDNTDEDIVPPLCVVCQTVPAVKKLSIQQLSLYSGGSLKEIRSSRVFDMKPVMRGEESEHRLLCNAA